MGFEAYYVNTLRPNDAAMLIIGDPIVQLGNAMNSAPYTVGHLAPSQDEVHRQATCPGTCTKDFSGTINVFAHFYHMHHYGKKMYTEKYAATYPQPPRAAQTSASSARALTIGTMASSRRSWRHTLSHPATRCRPIAGSRPGM